METECKNDPATGMKFTRQELKDARAILRETNRLLQRPKELLERREALQKKPKTENAMEEAAGSHALAEQGMKTGSDVTNMMRSVLADLIRGSLAPDVCRAACRACGVLLKIAELESKYGPISVLGRQRNGVGLQRTPRA